MKRKKPEQPECTGLCSMCGKDHGHCMCLSDAFNLVLRQIRNPKRTKPPVKSGSALGKIA